jgi:hypothetical protein
LSLRRRRADWAAIKKLYDALLVPTGSPVVAINRAVAIAELRGPAAGLEALDALARDARFADYQPYWAARARLLARNGSREADDHACQRAIGLESDPAGAGIFAAAAGRDWRSLVRREVLRRSSPSEMRVARSPSGPDPSSCRSQTGRKPSRDTGFRAVTAIGCDVPHACGPMTSDGGSSCFGSDQAMRLWPSSLQMRPILIAGVEYLKKKIWLRKDLMHNHRLTKTRLLVAQHRFRCTSLQLLLSN